MDPSTFDLYHERVIDALNGDPVMSLFFPELATSLIIDMRSEGAIGPAIITDGMVPNPEARLRSFRRLRPGLPLPENLTLIPWPGAYRAFAESGAIDALLRRCHREGGDELVREAKRQLLNLRIRERATLKNIVLGTGMHTVWQRPAL